MSKNISGKFDNFTEMVIDNRSENDVITQFKQAPGSNRCWVFASNYVSYIIGGTQFGSNELDKAIEKSQEDNCNTGNHKDISDLLKSKNIGINDSTSLFQNYDLGQKINFLKNCVMNDIPVILGITNGITGHAVVLIGYLENIKNKNIISFKISDSESYTGLGYIALDSLVHIMYVGVPNLAPYELYPPSGTTQYQEEEEGGYDYGFEKEEGGYDYGFKEN